MRTITLELLRHGPPHNQLLSPLTPYMALCENHAAVTVRVPYEHAQFLLRLSALNYGQTDQNHRELTLGEVARALGDMLGLIPGLNAEFNRAAKDQGERITHLRLIVSASELAILPFEIALAPEGLPGAGQSLLLQPEAPVCLTRETRRVPGASITWPDEPRILFAFASPPGVASVPFEAHHLALRRAVDPWIGSPDRGDAEGEPGAALPDATAEQDAVKKHLVVLPDASARLIAEACASGEYTHVHILAHGHEIMEGFDTRFGIALMGEDGGTDVVNGERLAASLRPVASRCESRLARPAVVTLAVCSAADGGSVVGAGGSVAHALHAAGIPVVIASQFPLSVRASVRLVQGVYERMLWGCDPRVILTDLRRRLRLEFPDTHDWASLSAYASLPESFDEKLRDIRIRRTYAAIGAALSLADAATARCIAQALALEAAAAAPNPAGDKAVLRDGLDQLLRQALERVERAKRELKALRDHTDFADYCGRICGLLGSTEKRMAEIKFGLAEIGARRDGSGPDPKAYQACLDHLAKARDYYWSAFERDRSASWAIVQYLSIRRLLKLLGVKQPGRRGRMDDGTLRELARDLSRMDRFAEESKHRIWALGNLIELQVIRAMGGAEGRPGSGDDRDDAIDQLARELAGAARDDAFELASVRRQLRRYFEWYVRLARSAWLAAGGPEGSAAAPGPGGAMDRAAKMAQNAYEVLQGVE